MPLYEYQCDACGCRFEVIQKYSDPAVESCKECGKGPVRRLISSPAIQFKGTGWYITDYAQKGKSDSAASAKSDTAKSDAAASDSTPAKTDSAKSDTSSAASTSKESKG